MSVANELAPPTATWDLSALFSGMDDPKIPAVWERSLREADAIVADFKGRLATPDLDADRLLAAIQRLEALMQETDKPVTYANLLFSADASDARHGAFLQDQYERLSEVRVKVLFVELELQAVDEAVLARCMADPRLAAYRHWMELVRKFAPYRLSEPKEALLEEVANVGARAWVRLFEEVTSNHAFAYRDPATGQTETLSQEQILDLLRSPNRAVRGAAAESLTRGLGELERVLAYTYNTLLLDQKIDDRLRQHPYPEHRRHLANELDKETVDLVVGLCKEKGDIVARYYRVKREILGLPELTHIDRYAPLSEAERAVSYDEGRDIVLEAFDAFSPEMATRAREFFEKSWIDAEPRPGKGGGAFCSSITPDTHPVLLLSYLNKVSDVMTLAHELGHGIHGSLARRQSYFNFNSTLPLAELASIFGEQLVFERLTREVDVRDRMAMLGEKIEGTFASVFRQAAMFRFEQRCHQHRREVGELAPEEFGAIWHEELQSMFGDSVILGSDHRKWWLYVWHFFGVPFYVYAYAFGELLSLAVFDKAKAQGPGFAEKYLEVLALGGSRSPDELMAILDVDLRSRDFWLGGFQAIEAMVADFERTWAEVRSTA